MTTSIVKKNWKMAGRDRSRPMLETVECEPLIWGSDLCLFNSEYYALNVADDRFVGRSISSHRAC